MPYIDPKKRPSIDQIIDPLIAHLKEQPLEDQDGALNYAITRLIKQVYPQKYFHLNRALGVLSAVTQEFYRRTVAPYENQKVEENGDVQ